MIFIISMIWCAVCISRSIYPFGQNLLDIGDMAEQCIPVYTHLWDVLHGEKALFFDWYTGMGNNMAGVVWHFGLISPFNLFFFFVGRSAIEASMSVFIWLKLISICFSIRFVLKRWFGKLSGAALAGLSLLYVFSAFNMQYYYAPMWLDVSFMFPLVMYACFLLMKEKRGTPYLAALTVTCLMGFQHTYMLVLMLVFLTGILVVMGGEEYREALPGLIWRSAVSLLLCAVVWLPGFLQILSAGRMMDSLSLNAIWSSVWIFYPLKWMKLINLGIPLALFLLAAHKKRRSRPVGFFIYVLLILCLPVVLESTNLLWHGGSYRGYTMRFGYMLTFWTVTAGAYGYQIRTEEASTKEKEHKVRAGILTAAGSLLSAGALGIQFQFIQAEIGTALIAAVLLLTVAGGVLLFCGRKRLCLPLMLAFIVLQSGALAFDSISVSFSQGDSAAGMSSRIAQEEEAEEGAEGVLNRIKSLDVTLSHNFPLIMRKSSMSSYLGVDGKEQLEMAVRLGYAGVGDRMSSYGGTLFSDALLGVRQTIAGETPDERLYVRRKTYGNRSVYGCRYGYKDGILLGKLPKITAGKEGNPLVYQKEIARAALGQDLFQIIGGKGRKMELAVEKRSLLYLYTPEMEHVRRIQVTDQNTGAAKTISLHESGWNNGIMELGMWEDAFLEVETDQDVQELYCAALDMEAFEQNPPEYAEEFTYQAFADAMELSLNNPLPGGYLFLPVYADEGWECEVNGQRTELSSFAGGCMAIPLQEGANRIRLRFWPKGLRMGAALTVAGILFLLGGMVIGKRQASGSRRAVSRKALNAFSAVLLAFWLIVTVIFYAIPIVYLAAFGIKTVLGALGAA